jgi:hypothetical protein
MVRDGKSPVFKEALQKCQVVVRSQLVVRILMLSFFRFQTDHYSYLFRSPFSFGLQLLHRNTELIQARSVKLLC